MKLKSFLALITIWMAALPLTAGAQEKTDTTVLDTMIVTDSVKKTKLLDTPGAITVLNTSDIRNSGQTKLSELISSIPGVVNQKSGSKTYFSIRGTRGPLSSGAVIYVDGRPINTGIYTYSNIDAISLDSVEKIEVIKSPPASIYGSNAARGVILITTKSGKGSEKPFTGTVSGEYGSWNTLKGTAIASGAEGRLDYGINLHAIKSDGYRGSDDDAKGFDAHLGYRLGGGRMELVGGYTDYFVKYPTGLDLEQLHKDRTSPGYYKIQGGNTFFVLPNQLDQQLSNIGLKYNYDRNDWLANASVIYTNDKQVYTQYEDQNNPNWNYRRADYRDDREDKRWDFKLGGGRTFANDDTAIMNTVTAGFDFMQSDFDQVRTYPFNTDPLSSSMESRKAKADIDATRKVFGYSLNNDFAWDRFRLLAGLRLNEVHYELENKVPASLDKSYYGDLDWNVAPSYMVVPGGNLFVSYTHANWYLPLGHYKLDMEYDHPDAQAKDLEPEQYSTWEAGFKHRLHKAFNYSVIYYHTTIEDKVVSFYDGTKFRGFRNAGTSIHQGWELEIDGRPCQWFGYRLNYTTIDAEWDKGSAKAYLNPDAATTTVIDLKGKQVNYVPDYEYTASFDFFLLRQSLWGSLTASVDIRGFGEQYEDYNNNLKMAAADFVDLKLTWDYGRWQLYLTGTNIFDRQWDKYVNSTGKSHDRIGGMSGIYPQNGRYIGIGGAVTF